MTLYRRTWRYRHPYIFAGLVFMGALIGALAFMVALVAWLAG